MLMLSLKTKNDQYNKHHVKSAMHLKQEEVDTKKLKVNTLKL